MAGNHRNVHEEEINQVDDEDNILSIDDDYDAKHHV